MKRFSKFVFRELEDGDSFAVDIKPKKEHKYIFEAEIEEPKYCEATAKGYMKNLIGSTIYNFTFWTNRIYHTCEFSKYYKDIIPIKQAKDDFLASLIIRKKHREEFK